MAFAFSAILYPHVHGLSLRLACPEGRTFGLTLFHTGNMRGLDLAYAPVTLTSAFSNQLMGEPVTYRFGSGRTAALAC